METRVFQKGEVIFREGDAGDCMFDVYDGKVGIYADYGTDKEKLLTDYLRDQYFGEMGLLDHAPRSATAVALAPDTRVGVISEESFGEFFKSNPARVLVIMQQRSMNLRKRTDEYVDVCRSIYELASKEGLE
jgi:CRP-like cAMP-binding protein